MARIQLPNGWQPRPYQLPAWTYLENGGKHAELIWHRRAGKDAICMHRASCAAFERVANYWHMLPQASQARKAIWDAVNPHTGKRRIDEAFPLELRKTTRNQEMQIEFVNGSTWQVVGSDNYNSLVGSTPAGVVYSEWALANPASRAYLRPMLAENGGWQLFITTPRGRNHAFTTYEAAKKDPNAFAQRLTAYETGVLSAERLAEERNAYIAEYGPEMGQGLFDQEYMCSFDAAILGAVLGRWMASAEEQGRVTHDVFDPYGAPIEISSDLGFRDTSSWWFWQPRHDGYGVVGYLGASGLDADDWIERLQHYIRKRGMKLGRIWLPHDAKNKTFSAKNSPLERFLAAFGADRVSMVPQTKIEHRTNAARRIISRCWFDEAECGDGLDGLVSWQYKYDDELKVFSKEPQHDWASHPGDAFSYGAQMLEERAPALPGPEQMRGLMVGDNEVTLDEMWASVGHERRNNRI